LSCKSTASNDNNYEEYVEKHIRACQASIGQNLHAPHTQGMDMGMVREYRLFARNARVLAVSDAV
jgi:hypothetical protein